MDNYKSNSNKSKKDAPAKAKIEKVTTGVVKTKKPGLFGVFVSDSVANIKDEVIYDILIPAAKKVITDGISMMLYGEPSRTDRKSTASRVSYRSYYDDRDRDRGRDRERDSRVSRSKTAEYNNIVLETRAEAEEVISRLDELIDVYGIASVGDLYDLVGIKGEYTDCNYGWTNVCDATHVAVRDGYLLKLPRVRPI